MEAEDAAAPVMRGFPSALTNFIGRQSERHKIGELLRDYRLVTITGPGGVGKTRLATEVARDTASRLADGAWLVELASLTDQGMVPTAVATAVGVRPAPGPPIVETLVSVLARQQVLLVLDSCEHLLAGVAQLCSAVLSAADDVRILVTSREPIGLAGEARFRLGPMELAEPGDERAAESEAVALFADRARRSDPRFALDSQSCPVVAQIVTRLDGMPLAIELAGARVEALGLDQLLARIDDRLGLLDGGDRLAPRRLRSLAATADWSYQLLVSAEKQVFRALAVFPGPFTLEAAEAVAGSDAGPTVLRLVDCSLLTPPSIGSDGRARYLMLETLRTYAAKQLAEAGETDAAESALARYAMRVATQAASGLETSTGELAALRWLDAEDVTVQHALSWCLDHDPRHALRLATALARWWSQRGRGAVGYELLTAAVAQAEPGTPDWRTAQIMLGDLATKSSPDYHRPLAHFTAACEGLTDGQPSWHLARALAGAARCQANLGQLADAAGTADRALSAARSSHDPEAEMLALYARAAAADYAGEVQMATDCMRQAAEIDPAEVSGETARRCIAGLVIVLIDADDLEPALQHAQQGLELARLSGDEKDQADFLALITHIHLRAGRHGDASALLREAIELASRTGLQLGQIGALDLTGFLCAATQRWADAVTVWAAHAGCLRAYGLLDIPSDARRRQDLVARASQLLGADIARAAEQRGTAMTVATASEYALLLTSGNLAKRPAIANVAGLSAREQELVTLVAHGNTDAQIASQLYISIRTVGSHLDRIRDKTGCRRRADLTRLALQAGLV
ncbi:MAG: LuxR C-terminal-related transcriptional regulator [Streptosporangiaceae bacterium]